MPKHYIVRLSQEERQSLKDLVSTGKTVAYKIKHANILLNIDVNGQGWTALARKPNQNPSRQRVCDGDSEAKLIALRCGEPPAGQARWTLRLLADKAVEFEIVPAISHETVRQVLKKRTQAASAPAVCDSTRTQR